MKLSILVPSVTNRRNTFLPKILDQLHSQVEPFNDVEVLVLIDNKTNMLGEKRNQLVNLAQGEYVVFVDDDDVLSDDYVSTLRQACITNSVDVITFTVNVSLNNGPYKPCYYDKDYHADYNREHSYHRLPNHICCVRRELALVTPYKPIVRGEDAAYSKDLHKKLTSQYIIDKVLYSYNFNINTTETQKEIVRNAKNRYSNS